jgi:hypothetical protein
MADQQDKKQNPQTGYFLTALGVIGISISVIGVSVWSTVKIVKLAMSIGVLGFGLWTLLKKKA